MTSLPILTLLLFLPTMGVRAEETIDESTPAKAIASLTDPKKLATLKGERASNPRLQKCLYWIEVDQRAEYPMKLSPSPLILRALELNGINEETPYGEVIRDSLVECYLVALNCGLFTMEGMNELRQGKSATITKGKYAGQEATAYHFIPPSVCPELDNQIFNLRLLPSKLNSSKGDKVEWKQVAFAEYLNKGGLLSAEGLEAVRKAYEKKAEGQSAPPLETETENQEAVKENLPPAVSLPFVLPVGLGIDQTRVQSATMGQWTYIMGDVVAIITASTATGAVTIPSKLGGLPVLKVGSSHDPIFGFNNTSVTSVSIPNSATTIGAKAFFGCKSLTNITIPKSVRRIDSYAFYGCTSLTTITIPSVSSIGKGAFAYCTRLTSITISPGTSIEGEMPTHIKVIRR